MTASALWQFDQLSPEARNAAAGAARTAGLRLNQWLGRLIAETAAAEGVVLGAAPRIVAPPPASPRPVPPLQPRAVIQPLPIRPVVPTQVVTAAAQPTPPQAMPSAPVTSRPSMQMTTPQPRPMPEPQQPSPTVEATTVMLSPTVLDPGSVGTRGDEGDAPEALVSAIARDGLRQPILARRKPDGRYEIIAGRRRWRAAKRVGLAQILVVVTTLADPEAVLASLTENLSEGTLPPVDEARAYLRLLTEFSLDPRDVCGAIGRDMTHVVRTLRLLGLSPRLRGFIATGRLSQAQAYALLDTPDPERAADQMLSEQAGVDEALRRIAAVPGGQRS
ncbi:MAG TPA: ParB/RepB/Spo0J family partition protein [Stellaceae bacterium]|nr:ParB/RepB/Spo0J family partition protein [Stellaceae bacterium]